jgi:hypothetical protein
MTSRSNLAVAAVVVALLAVSIALQVVRDRTYGAARTEDNLLYVPSGPVLERMSLSFDSVVADAYWIRAIQHYGGDRRSTHEHRYQLLYPLLDITTTLDPRFTIAYRFGAMFLGDPYPSGAGRPDLAIKLLLKGIQAQPDKWEYYEDLAFVYYWHLRDLANAARWFERAGAVPGAPWWLKSLGAVTLAQGGNRRESRFLWQQILNDARDNWLRDNARMRLQQLDAWEQVEQLTDVVGEYRRRTGRLPESWTSLVRAGLLRAEPLDPSGTPYQLNAGTGDVSVSPSSTLYPLPVEPPSSPPPPPS